MTIISGKVVKAQTGKELIDKLDIDPIELFEILMEDEKEEIIDTFNKYRHDWDADRVDNVGEFPDFVYDQWTEWITDRNPEILALEVMEERGQEYVHIEESASFGQAGHHIVVEV